MSENPGRPQRSKKPPTDYYSGIDPGLLSDDDFEAIYPKAPRSSKSNSDSSVKNTQSPAKKEMVNLYSSSDFEVEEEVPKPASAKNPVKRIQSESEEDYSLSDGGLSDEEDEESEFESDSSFSGKKATKKKSAAPKIASAKKSPATKVAKVTKPVTKTVKASTPTTVASKSAPKPTPKAAAKSSSIPSLLKSSASKGTTPTTIKKVINSNGQIPNGIHFYPDKAGKPKAGLSKLANIPSLHPSK